MSPCQELDDAANTTLLDASIPVDAPSLDEAKTWHSDQLSQEWRRASG